MPLSPPRLIVTALRGGSGKTILSLGLTAAWTEEGRRVASFKKGPDFIDPGWLSLAAGDTCHNLDAFMMDRACMLRSFLHHARNADIALIEGNRGLFDGVDQEGSCSSSELARMLRAPAVLIVDVTMTTRTIAAVVMGCQRFEPDLDLKAVILNRVGGTRQEAVARSAVEHYCEVPVLGSVRKIKENRFPERHMGLIPHQERGRAQEAVAWARAIVRESLDLNALWKLAGEAPPLDEPPGASSSTERPGVPPDATRPRIGFVLDNAFWFYYPENLTELESRGAELVQVNSLRDEHLPDLDALYIGGGFPETQAERLAANHAFRDDLRMKIEEGLPVYAECGGLMVLGEHLVVNGTSYPMAGALPVDFVLEKKPQGHGYTVLEVENENPFYERGTILRGHEFHYSRPIVRSERNLRTACRVRRGRGFNGSVDGLCKKNLLGLYTHVHALGTPVWADRLVEKARAFSRAERSKFLKDF